MPHKGPHVSISAAFVVNRILRINLDEYENWPDAVRELAAEIAEELFLVAYNPFISPATVKASVDARFRQESQALAHQYATSIGEGITMFWSAYDAEAAFRKELIVRLAEVMPADCVITWLKPPPTPRTCVWNCLCWWSSPPRPNRRPPWYAWPTI